MSEYIKSVGQEVCLELVVFFKGVCHVDFDLQSDESLVLTKLLSLSALIKNALGICRDV